MQDATIKELLADLADSADPELHKILKLDGHGDPRQAVLRRASDGRIPAHSWDGRWIFSKSELKQFMAERQGA